MPENLSFRYGLFLLYLQTEKEDNVMEKMLTIKYKEYPSVDALGVADAELMRRAVAATDGAYAPYSGFRVGAAVRLADGSVVVGSNQENAAYPSGLCAERTAIFAASAQRPEVRDYDALAIVGRNAEGELCARLRRAVPAARCCWSTSSVRGTPCGCYVCWRVAQCARWAVWPT